MRQPEARLLDGAVAAERSRAAADEGLGAQRRESGRGRIARVQQQLLLPAVRSRRVGGDEEKQEERRHGRKLARAMARRGGRGLVLQREARRPWRQGGAMRGGLQRGGGTAERRARGAGGGLGKEKMARP